MSVKEFAKEINGSRVEGELIKTAIYSLIVSLLVFGMIYFLKLRAMDVMSKYGLYLFLSILSFALIVPTIRQVRAYKHFSCMSGMMIGMTAGMISGFLPGFYIGATNGMFYGSIFGMFVGIIVGTWMGKCCGVMGLMEGLMAGFMGGLMGAMTSVMMLNDHLKAAAVIVFIICSVILVALNYMIYQDRKEDERQVREDHFVTITISFVLTAITIWLMIFGPRSGLFG